MSPSIAALFYVAVILGLFWLDRDKARTSPALWVPVIWLSLAGSRSVSEWLGSAPPGASAAALLEGDPINRLAYTGLVALGLVVLLFRGPKVLKLLQANGAVVVFLLYCALSLTWAEYPDVGFKRWVKVVGDFVMVLIVVSDRDPSVAIRRLLTRTGFLLIPLSVLMIKYYPHLARYYDRWDWSTYYSGVTTNKNALGVICLLFGLASAWQLLGALFGPARPGRGRRLIAHGAMLAMVVWLFTFARSMTSLSCFLVGIIVLSVTRLQLTLRKPRMVLAVEFRPVVLRPLMVHALVASLIAIPAVILFCGIEVILEMLGRDPTLTDRTRIWGLLLSLAPDAWFGAGFENFWLGPRLEIIWRQVSFAPNQSHNGYIEIFVNLGWVGIALLAMILAVGYRTVMTGLPRSPLIGGLMLAYFVVGIVFNFTEAGFFRIAAPISFAFLLAITRVPDLRRSKTQPPFDRRPTERMTPIQVGAGDKVRELAVSRNA